MSHSANVFNTVILYAAIIVMLILRQRTRAHPANAHLVKGERLRPLAITVMDPILSLVFVGYVLWDLATRDVSHAGAAIVGALIGIPIGLMRARVQYVRAVPEAKAVVFRRSGAEYVLLGILLVLRLAESSIENSHTTALTLLLGGMVALAVAESITRTAAITVHYYRDAAHPPAEASAPSAPSAPN